MAKSVTMVAGTRWFAAAPFQRRMEKKGSFSQHISYHERSMQGNTILKMTIEIQTNCVFYQCSVKSCKLFSDVSCYFEKVSHFFAKPSHYFTKDVVIISRKPVNLSLFCDSLLRFEDT